ncbi:c-type cytochrome [Methylobacterium nonmethylotrophicum]|uniref:Cytochrome C n=1 Tax=Methylobacterium nonmethylotrophicum TaxID=1141884 RepID=A0A4Z0NPS1_9HYPH|nr:c-type cytochrome [Methylobacterium nonmethylotrophicum]TGD98648.1 cytochrome C [Methylobacterium nonmethylotrophicum]
MRRLALLLLLATPAAAAPPPGATTCSGCHGAPGGAVPSLAGHSAEDIAAAMAAFRTGARPATVMNRIAKGFSDEESRAIAAWIAQGGGQ